jgi:hypothetical protein
MNQLKLFRDPKSGSVSLQQMASEEAKEDHCSDDDTILKEGSQH